MRIATCLIVLTFFGSAPAMADMTPGEANGIARASLAMLHRRTCATENAKLHGDKSCASPDQLISASFGEYLS
ncbi:hypothetical protein E0I74_29255 [Rhizobium laguerreae]|uniref:hypothetical protein n=1 Tax=Rhizobium laguerreae TaxID=1076926 RepID=UPI0010392EF2|nr:hypothetical protein [Rhizobium laguerreae]MBY3256697.1 hypothetical protein [Rhizobium laguerreae]MBY3281881.1 hypothetical protein [Rhizobium laguerreae]MBY3291585.1 hypothetical protein [Rhizobium laguerreae]MBY3313353.1 hypothetical protein [Rhizobium laguerreae]MBY3322765.1 hypothetical protein [Rhizobium laguerreae]